MTLDSDFNIKACLYSFIRERLNSVISLQNISPTMQTADVEAFQKALTEQGQLFRRHQQVLTGVTHSFETLAHQQTEQQNQLAQLMTSVKGLTSQLQNMNLNFFHARWQVFHLIMLLLVTIIGK